MESFPQRKMTISGPAKRKRRKDDQKRGMLSTLGQALCAHWRNTVYWALCALLGGMLPLWINLFVRRIYGRPLDLESFTLRGDLVLYAAAFFAPAIFQIAVRMRDKDSILAVGAVITAVIALLTSAVVYLAVNPGVVPGGLPPQVHDYTFVNEVSCGLLLLSFLLSICVFLNEQQLQFETFERAEKEGEKALEEKMEVKNPAPANAVPLEPLSQVDVPPSEEALKQKFKEDEHG